MARNTSRAERQSQVKNWLMMRRIYLFALRIRLLGSNALAQRDADPASLYAGADIVSTGRVEKLSSFPSGLNARFEVAQRIKGKTGTKKYLQAQLPIQRLSTRWRRITHKTRTAWMSSRSCSLHLQLWS